MYELKYTIIHLFILYFTMLNPIIQPRIIGKLVNGKLEKKFGINGPGVSKIISWYWPCCIKDNQHNFHVIYTEFQLRFKADYYRIQAGNMTAFSV